jgi:molecular chaperone DnaK
MGRVVGIDLGTTNSVVAVMEGGKPVVIANTEGMRTTPSVIGVSKEGERLVGQMARRQSVLDPQNTFYNVKRFIGRKYAELTPDSKQVPYTVRRDESGNVKIKCPRLEREFAPEEISAMVLRKLADEASRYLGEPVTGAVITVPAYFNDSQRQATRDAGRIAGLDVKRILNEPTAASLAYGLDRRQSETILVFDLGGGTFDVSVLDVGDGVFEVRATSGDTQLGGGDFDKKIVDWLAEQFLETEGIDLRRDRQSLQRLTEAAEKAKIELSGVSVTEINLPFITATEDGPKHIETRMTRAQFERLCEDLVSRLRGPVKQAVRDAGLGPQDIDEIVLVGGGTRMPMVQDLVYSLIDREANQNVNPDEVVAVGAAIQAGILGGELKDILLLDVTPVSIGLETIGGLMKKLIPRNTTIPVRRSDVFSTSEDNQTSVEINIVQGEREMAAGNKTLGRFKLMGIPPSPRGIPQVQVAFDIDANGILQVTAMDRTTGREQSITIQGASTLSDEEVRIMLKEAEEFAESDRLRREKVEKRNRSEALTFQAERQLREATLDFGMNFVSPYRSRIEPLATRLRESLANNDDRGIDIADADLRDALYDLQREVYDRNQEEREEGGFFKSVKDFFLDEDEDYYSDGAGGYRGGGPYGGNPYGGYGGLNSYNPPGNYNQGSYDWGRGTRPYTGGYSGYDDGYGNAGGGANDGGRNRDANRDLDRRDSYGRDSYGQDGGRDSYGQDGGRDSYGQETGRDGYGQGGSYSQDADRTRYGRTEDRDSYGGSDYADRGVDRGVDRGADRSADRDPNRAPRSSDYGDRGGARRGDERRSGSEPRPSAADPNAAPPRDGYSSGGRGESGYYEAPPPTRRDDDYGRRPQPDRPSGRKPPARPDYGRDNWDDADDWL